jgi:Nif-specific regulatory protein
VDVRVIAATNRSLPKAVEAGSFRNDLYFRLNVITLPLPSLRDRREDIPALANHFITKASKKCNVRPRPLSPEARACLINYDWPGNVRELENAIERAVVLGVSDCILTEDLPDTVLESAPTPASEGAAYQSSVKEQKKQVILKALQQANGSYTEAAKVLGLHPNSLLRLIRNLKLKESKSQFEGSAAG